MLFKITAKIKDIKTFYGPLKYLHSITVVDTKINKYTHKSATLFTLKQFTDEPECLLKTGKTFTFLGHVKISKYKETFQPSFIISTVVRKDTEFENPVDFYNVEVEANNNN